MYYTFRLPIRYTAYRDNIVSKALPITPTVFLLIKDQHTVFRIQSLPERLGVLVDRRAFIAGDLAWLISVVTQNYRLCRTA
jgi:hypothetical protein